LLAKDMAQVVNSGKMAVNIMDNGLMDQQVDLEE
jgi:hypothetical protein